MFSFSTKIVLNSKTCSLFSSFTKVLFSVCLVPWRQRALLNESFAPLQDQRDRLQMIILREGTGASSRNVQTILVPEVRSFWSVIQKDRGSGNENAWKPTELNNVCACAKTREVWG